MWGLCQHNTAGGGGLLFTSLTPFAKGKGRGRHCTALRYDRSVDPLDFPQLIPLLPIFPQGAGGKKKLHCLQPCHMPRCEVLILARPPENANHVLTSQALIDKVRQRAVRQTITTLRALYKDYLPAERDSLLKNPDWTSGDRMKHFLRPFFNEFDTDRSGAIGVDELQGLLVKLGEKADRTTAEALLAAVDKDKSGFIEFDEFLEVIGKQMQDAYMKEIGGCCCCVCQSSESF